MTRSGAPLPSLMRCPLAGLPEGEPRPRGIDEDAGDAHVAELAAIDLHGRAELLRLRRSRLDVGDADVREPLVVFLAAGDSANHLSARSHHRVLMRPWDVLILPAEQLPVKLARLLRRVRTQLRIHERRTLHRCSPLVVGPSRM